MWIYSTLAPGLLEPLQSRRPETVGGRGRGWPKELMDKLEMGVLPNLGTSLGQMQRDLNITFGGMTPN